MSRTRITTEEIENLLRFGKELERRMDAAGSGFTDISRATGGSVSVGYISDIVRAARGDSQKHFRLGRGKVAKIAEALKWPEHDALAVAGFQSSTYSSEYAESIEEVLKNAQYFHAKGLSESDIEIIRPILEALDKQVETLTKD